MGGASRLGQGIRGAGLLLARRTGEREHIMLSTRSCATGACSTSLASRRSLKRRPMRRRSDAFGSRCRSLIDSVVTHSFNRTNNWADPPPLNRAQR